MVTFAVTLLVVVVMVTLDFGYIRSLPLVYWFYEMASKTCWKHQIKHGLFCIGLALSMSRASVLLFCESEKQCGQTSCDFTNESTARWFFFFQSCRLFAIKWYCGSLCNNLNKLDLLTVIWDKVVRNKHGLKIAGMTIAADLVIHGILHFVGLEKRVSCTYPVTLNILFGLIGIIGIILVISTIAVCINILFFSICAWVLTQSLYFQASCIAAALFLYAAMQRVCSKDDEEKVKFTVLFSMNACKLCLPFQNFY